MREEALKREVVRRCAARVLFAEVAADAADGADLADGGALVRIRAEDMERCRGGHERDEPSRARGHTLPAADAEVLLDPRQTVFDADRVLRADARAASVAEAAVGASLAAAGGRGGRAAVAESVVGTCGDGLGTGSAAPDERDAPFGRSGGNAEDAGDGGRAGVVTPATSARA